MAGISTNKNNASEQPTPIEKADAGHARDLCAGQLRGLGRKGLSVAYKTTTDYWISSENTLPSPSETWR